MSIERITFESGGETLVGHLHWPSARDPRATIVVTGSWTTVKEQMPAVYARRLTDAGLAALTFDFRNWGESGGAPRAYESPESKIEDIRSAAEYLMRLPAVDPDRIGGLAVCASAGYMAHAVARGAPIRSLVLVASWLHDPESILPLYGGEDAVRGRVESGRRAREAFERSGEVAYVPAYDPDDPNAAMFFPLDYYASPERGAVPQWTNRFATMSWVDWFDFDALGAAEGVNVPTLLVHSDGAALPDNARRFYAALPGPKHLLWTDGAQTDFYDREPFVSRSVAAAVEHFGETLESRSDPPRIDVERARAEIIDTVAALLLAVDTLDWEGVRRVLHDPIHTDYTSLFGGTPVTQAADDLIATWGAFLPGFDATQHLAGPVLAEIRGATASARCSITGVHRLGEADWTVGGHYAMELLRRSGRWLIASITLHTAWVWGDAALVEKAQARAASHRGRAASARVRG
ncbi:MAG TPA: nuclear transport factor 2 family protein [Longimicrobiales bacterium]|nr:nuclear transport factor 2 family protein [Longimicrobiales bacterium]